MKPRAWLATTRLFLAAALAAGMAAGCTSSLQVRKLGPGAAAPGLFAADTAYPNRLMPEMTNEPIRYTRDDIVIGEWVDDSYLSRGVGFRLLGDIRSNELASGGASDYGRAFEHLREVHHYDGLMNKFVDTRGWQIDLYFIRFGSIELKIGGVGFNFKNAPHVVESERPKMIRSQGPNIDIR